MNAGEIPGLLPADAPDGRIGPYRILRALGEGGFGTVFDAEQEQPVRRRVALKILKPGMDTREVIARFEVERQALALMDHPHIAGVLDAGATAGGRPYFVMELVEGDPIAQYCNEHQLPIEQRLALFEQVCAAIQHAHAKGVIHRDLKPGNILVRTQDGAPSAKVIDFGIAKATSGRLTERSLFTEAELMMGTPTYMSPEQAAGSVDIDARTDVYALGVILYELLTDTTPLDSDTLRVAGYHEVQRIIREVEPMRPSVRLSKSLPTRAGIAASRRTEPRKLTIAVRGELDWIAMKAIEKDRSRRYESASALAADVRRYLSGETVLAAPPSASYRFGKFVRRHKGVVATASLAALALLAGLAGFAWQAREARAREAELRDVTGFQAAMLSQIDPPKAGDMLSADVLRRFDAGLAQAGVPADARAARRKAFAAQWARVNATDAAMRLVDETVLKPAIVAIDRQFANQPAVNATLRESLADRYTQFGLFDAALAQQQAVLALRRQALGEEDPATLKSINDLGALFQVMGRMDEGEPLLRRALAGRRRVLGPDDPDTLDTVNNLGLLLYAKGDLAKAEPFVREAMDKRRRVLGAADERTLASINNMGLLLQDEGKLAAAEPYFKEALSTARRIYGQDKDQTIFMLNNLAMLMQQQEKLAEAEPYSREALQRARKVWGGEHPYTLEVMNNLGRMLLTEHKLDEAAPLIRETLEKNRRVQGDENPDTLMSVDVAGALADAQGRYAEAEALLAPAEAVTRKVFTGDQIKRVGSLLLHLGQARTGLHRFEAAESNLLEAQALVLKSFGPAHRAVRDCDEALVALYSAWDDAEPDNGHAASALAWKAKLAEAEKAGKAKRG